MAENTGAIAEARAVEKFYPQPNGNRVQVIAPTSLSISPDSFLALLGPSGSGKSTLLRMLTGLVPPSAGEIFWHGSPLAGRTPDASIVFQNFALFPWLTVLENVEAPLQAQGAEAVERRKRALKILDIVGLDGFENAYPKELSGGMKQRVGFARALVVEPEVLFMDEPFSALDVLTAETLRNELLELWHGRKIPTRAVFMVTHNIEEAILLADRVVVLGANPACIRTEFDVRLPHPRDRKSPEFLALVDYVYKVLTNPTLKQVQPAPGSETATAPARNGEHLTLPHARPGGISGLLEILLDRGGKDDLYKLADELMMEVDDVLPIFEGCRLLGFLHVHEGDAEITPEGRAFADADILARKVLFAEGAANIPIFQRIQRALQAKANRSLPYEFFIDVLEEHFSEKEARRQMDTALLWGRYAEMFDFDAEQGRLYIPEPSVA